MCFLLVVFYQSETTATGRTGVERRSNSGPPSGEVTVYYDYIENGQLTGGKITIFEPTVSGETLLEAAAVWPVTTIIDNGPSSNRIDVVVLGDGYQASELDTYSEHVLNVVGGFFTEEPFGAYSSFFNVHQVDVVSNESGVDEPDYGIYRDTALDMTYNCSDIPRLLCVSVGKAWEAAGSAPDVELIWALANSSRYGGAGYPDLATAAGNHNSSVEFMLHESGHAFGKLTDEYYYLDGSTYSGYEPIKPNVSIYNESELLSHQTKWYRWLDKPNVGTYEGAHHYQYGIYRPTYNSKMRSLNRPFEEINVEQLVINFYRVVSPIDDATEYSQEPLESDTVFFVTPMEPTDHTLDVQWSVDGFDVPGATGLTFEPSWLPKGTYDVAVTVVDNTPRVRDEGARAMWLTDVRQWRIERENDKSDLSGDCFTNFVDFDIFARWWPASDCNGPDLCDGADLEVDNVVNIADLRVLTSQWLLCQCEPCVWHEPPVVNITTPIDGQPFLYNRTREIEIEAYAKGNYSLLFRVEFFAEGVKIGQDTDGSDGWKMTWTGFQPSWNSITAKATDNLGATTTSQAVNINMK